jgi:hypothetical protein
MTRRRLTVVHNLPGRLRVRLPTGVEGRELDKHVGTHPGVKGYHRSARTGSMLIHYHPEETSAETLLELVASLAGVETHGIEAESRDVAIPVPLAIRRAAAKLNAAVAARTAHHLDLRTILALSLGGWAVTQVVRGRARALPWSTALWYAYELFRHRTVATSLRAHAGIRPASAVSRAVGPETR